MSGVLISLLRENSHRSRLVVQPIAPVIEISFNFNRVLRAEVYGLKVSHDSEAKT